MPSVSIFTPAPQFSNDVADIVRVFFGKITLFINEEGGEIIIRHQEETTPDGVLCRVSLNAQFTREELRIPESNELLEKRYRKRQLKLLVYDCLKEMTGFAPPWGALTGIRPSRLVYTAMDSGLSLDAACKQVQNTFDVQNEKMQLLHDLIEVQSQYPQPTEKDVDLYVGIPFCVSRCAYCSFLSEEVGKGKQLEPYTEALEQELAQTLQLIDELGLRPRAFYMGGGTPTSLPAPLLARVLKACKPFMDRVSEVTVEAGRPDTIDREKLEIILQSGATRISINPQTGHDITLQRIGRHHTTKQTEDAYALARQAGFHHINMDLIAGLPGENLKMFEETLRWSYDLAPESLTIHSLSIKRSSILHLQDVPLPDGQMTAEMTRLGQQAALSRGMKPYYLYRQKYMAGHQENVGYALPGHACLYNIDMMEETGTVLAVGAGAISKRVLPEKGHIERAPNVSDICHYISRIPEMVERKRAVFTADWSHLR